MPGISGAAISKLVIYREPGRLASVTGIIIAANSVKVADTPLLTDDDHVHLAILSPFVAGAQITGTQATWTPLGMYQAWNVPYWPLAPKATYLTQPVGTWTWPF